MTSISLHIKGAGARATVTGTLTSGMVGIPLTIEYDEAWDGLTKNLVCQCREQGSDAGECRTILDVGETAVVAHEVMKAGTHLYLGVEGFSADGKLVIPTTWALCGVIEKGANTAEDLTTDPTLPVWEQLQTQIGQLREDAVTREQMTGVLEVVQSAAQAAAISAGRAEAAARRAEEAAGVGNGEGGQGSSQNTDLTTGQVNALDGMFRVCAFVQEDVSAQYRAFRAAFGLDASGGDAPDEPEEPVEKTLTGISATYSGGSVPVGTAVSALTGITVTADYSDGSSETVSGYTLSGEIAEGENTITVTYQDMTSTFVVNGYDDSNKIVIVNGFLGNSSTATSAVESNPSFPNAWASTTAIPVNPGDTVTVNVDPSTINTLTNVRIRAYDTDGVYVASSGQNGAEYYVFTATAAGFVRIACTNIASCDPVRVTVENADGTTTYVVSDQR